MRSDEHDGGAVAARLVAHPNVAKDLPNVERTSLTIYWVRQGIYLLAESVCYGE